MKLSEKLKAFRADRPDEWTMDEFIRGATELEKELKPYRASREIDGLLGIDKEDDSGWLRDSNTHVNKSLREQGE